MTRMLVVLVMVASASVASAQAPGETPPAPIPAAPKPARHKEPGTAVALSIATPVVGFVMLAGGLSHENGSVAVLGLGTMYVGPSTGQWYAGRVGGIGLAVRAVGAIALFKGIAMSMDAEGRDCLGYTDAECAAAEKRWAHDDDVAAAYGYTGVALWVGSSIYDIVMAHRATSAWNREHALTITPALIPASGGRATGMALSLTF